MRARNIKPSFFKNPELGALLFAIRLLFVGLWTLADRMGRLEDRPSRILAELFPYDRSVTVEQVDEWLTALAESPERFIVRYVINGSAYIQISNFLKHQSPHIKEQESTIPAPDSHQTDTGQASGQHPLNPDSLIPPSLIPYKVKIFSPPLRDGGDSSAHDSSGESAPPSGNSGDLSIRQRVWFDEVWPNFWNKRSAPAAQKLFAELVTTPAQFDRVLTAVKTLSPQMWELRKGTGKRGPTLYEFLYNGCRLRE